MTRVFFALVALMISLWVFSAPPARGTEITLRAQLEALAAKYGFVISGLDHISAGAAQRSLEGNVEDRLKAKIGFLKSVRVGNVSANDIKVTIISEDRLGNTMLLGMSFLERFKVTIDDARNELILLAK